MTKRLAIIALAAIMMLGVFGLAGCGNISLKDYKATKSQSLQDYANAKGESNYCTDGWEAICKAVANGKKAIEDATTKPAVTTAFNDAKNAIDKVEREEPVELSEELESRIKADFLQQFGYALDFGGENVNRFYGLYNEAAVFFVANGDDALKTITISGVEFSYNCGWTIWVWKNGNFYDLENITVLFDAGILTQKNVETIGVAHAKANEKELSQ